MKKIKEIPVTIPIDKQKINGDLFLPEGAKLIVLFAHGSGSSRFSPRNRFVAKMFNEAGIATLLMDLLTREEEEIDIRTAQFRFNIDLLSQRLVSATEWIKKNPATRELAIGYFGSSTGAAAALIAATKLPAEIVAIVSRGGRIDLALEYLHKVKAPTLCIVGGKDTIVLNLNQEAMKHIPAEKKLEIVPEASHLFEEPGKLEEVAKLATKWFLQHLEIER